MIALFTDGYFYGVAASVVAMVAINSTLAGQAILPCKGVFFCCDLFDSGTNEGYNGNIGVLCLDGMARHSPVPCLRSAD